MVESINTGWAREGGQPAADGAAGLRAQAGAAERRARSALLCVRKGRKVP